MAVPVCTVACVLRLAQFKMCSVDLLLLIISVQISNKLLSKHVKMPCAKYKGREQGCTTEKVKWPIPIPSQLIVVCHSEYT